MMICFSVTWLDGTTKSLCSMTGACICCRSKLGVKQTHDKTYKKVLVLNRNRRLKKFIIYFLWSVVTMVAAKCSQQDVESVRDFNVSADKAEFRLVF